MTGMESRSNVSQRSASKKMISFQHQLIEQTTGHREIRLFDPYGTRVSIQKFNWRLERLSVSRNLADVPTSTNTLLE
jgi:hypothetical protein